MPSIFNTADSFLSSLILAFFGCVCYQADGSTLNTTQALKWELSLHRQGWFFTGLAGPRDDSPYAFNGSTGGGLWIKSKDQTWRVSRFPSLLNGFLVVAPVLETCQDDMNVVQKIDPLRRWLHDLNDQICDPFGILWYHKPWAASMSYHIPWSRKLG